MPECHPLPQQIWNDFFLQLWATQSTHVHRGTWLLLLSLYPSASVLFHLRSVSFHSFEVAVREFPKKKGLLSVNCILGIVNQSETIWANGDHKAGNTSHGRHQLFPSHQTFWHLVPPSYLSTVSTSSTCVYRIYLPFIPTILSFCHPDQQHRRG